MLWQKLLGANASGLKFVGGTSATQAANSGAGYTISLTSLTGGLGSAPAAGDIVIVATGWAYTTDGNPGVTTSGYTELCDLYAHSGADANFSVNWKIMGPTPDTNVSVTTSASTASAGHVTVIQVWRGVNQTTPIDVTTTTSTSTTASNPPNSPSITPVTRGCVILSCGLYAGNDSTAATLTTPSGMQNGVIASINASYSASAGIASYSDWISGAYDPAAWGISGTSSGSSSAAASVVLRPA